MINTNNLILEKSEKILKESEKICYAGVGIINQGSAFGTQFGGGMVGGFYSGKQIKREGSIFDSKNAHLYLTNKRLIFCKTKIKTFGGEEKEIGMPFAEIDFKNIKGINPTKKLNYPAIEISVSNNGQLDNIKFWFFGLTENKKYREPERNEVLELIKKQL
jgi:hypothetical protein